MGYDAVARGTLGRLLASWRLSDLVGHPVPLAGWRRSELIDRLDLAPGEHRSLRDSPWAGRASLAFLALAVLTFAAYWASGRALVDLQVTLNRIEAAGKGQGKRNR